MHELLTTLASTSPLALLLAALWKAPDWIQKWLDVRKRWRDER